MKFIVLQTKQKATKYINATKGYNKNHFTINHFNNEKEGKGRVKEGVSSICRKATKLNSTPCRIGAIFALLFGLSGQKSVFEDQIIDLP